MHLYCLACIHRMPWHCEFLEGESKELVAVGPSWCRWYCRRLPTLNHTLDCQTHATLAEASCSLATRTGVGVLHIAIEKLSDSTEASDPTSLPSAQLQPIIMLSTCDVVSACFAAAVPDVQAPNHCLRAIASTAAICGCSLLECPTEPILPGKS